MRAIPHLLWLTGVSLFVYAAGSYCAHALPYQDPTPKLLAIQRGQLQVATLFAIVGILFFVIGVWLAFRRKETARSP